MKIIVWAVLTPFFLSACEKEKADTSVIGDDNNRIVAFEPAAENGRVYSADTAEGAITATVPKGTSLDGTAVSYKMRENSTPRQ